MQDPKCLLKYRSVRVETLFIICLEKSQYLDYRFVFLSLSFVLPVSNSNYYFLKGFVSVYNRSCFCTCAFVLHWLDFKALFVRKLLPGLAIELIKTGCQQGLCVMCM